MKSAGLFLEAAVAVLIARIATRTVKFATVARVMGWQEGDAGAEVGAEQEAIAQRVGKAVSTASRRFRFKDACMAEAMAAKWMLGRRGMMTTLHIGMRIKGAAAQAPESERIHHAALHAWLNAGAFPVLGNYAARLATIARYS